MNKHIWFLAIYLITISCNGQSKDEGPSRNDLITSDYRNIKHVDLKNKMHCSYLDFKKEPQRILKQDEIKELLRLFNASKLITNDIATHLNYGFMEITFKDNEKDYYFDILFTVRDGVIICDNYNGKLYKNNDLEMFVAAYF